MAKQFPSPQFLRLPPKQGKIETGQESAALQARYARGMLEMRPEDAIGVALSYLLMASYSHPEMLRAVLNEKVVREGFGGVSMIETLTRASR